MNDTVLLERDGGVATLTLNRPDALNVLDLAMVDALVARTAEVAADDTLRVVVVRGAGRHFMAGGDIRTFATHLEEPPAVRRSGFQRMVEQIHAAIECLHRMPHPVIGRVHGAVAGFGLSLMNACDLVVASDDAYFASAYRQIALTPDGGGSWSLPRLVGMRKAMEILLARRALRRRRGARRRHRQQGRAGGRARRGHRGAGPFDRRRARACVAQDEASRPRVDGTHAVGAAAGRGGELRRVHGERRFRRRHRRVPRQAAAAVWAQVTGMERRRAPVRPLEGKTLFITGGSRGIGLAIAVRAAQDGANVAIAAKTVEPHPKLPGTIHTAAAEIEQAGGTSLPSPATSATRRP